MTIVSHSPAQTRRIGASLGQRLCPGDVVLLQGDLGAGKSEFARGIAQGMGVDGPLPSPSFPILLVHEGREHPLYHMDWYRLADAGELYAAGLEEYLGGDGIAVVEWPQQAQEAIPARHLLVDIAFGQSEEERVLVLALAGGMQKDLLLGLEEVS